MPERDTPADPESARQKPQTSPAAARSELREQHVIANGHKTAFKVRTLYSKRQQNSKGA